MEKRRWVKQASGSGIEEVYYLIAAFEEVNRVKVDISLTLERPFGVPELQAKATAHELALDGSVASVLVSRSVICSAMNLRTVEAVAIHLLYMLDGALAQRELSLAPKE